MKQIEVFGMPNDYQLASLGRNEPHVHNGQVAIKRYRITVEEIEEPIEVLRERLTALKAQRLHTDADTAIQKVAVALGVTV